jgi:hypothetical protein
VKAVFNCLVPAQAGTALPSPTKATSVALLWPISSGAMSSWMTWASSYLSYIACDITYENR